MVGARDANPPAVTRVHREAPVFARHMEAANVACGVTKDLTMGLATLLVSGLQEAKTACVFITIHSQMTVVSMGLEHWVLSVSSEMPLLREITIQTLKQAATHPVEAFSCILWRLLVVWQSQLLRVGCMVVTFCQCSPMA
ncbi:hypothetical protein GUJ93_ZPchr0002g26096 [Zizania palustris]|uniref:Uncharacterized protein n=1 Tax=Zizania palustris TaxID=103762 RepID=A0A8J5RXC4_ZIZPA|nr:hypothetical protein GUJ93_ZPchr0002g26096 [Zizania palustris]